MRCRCLTLDEIWLMENIKNQTPLGGGQREADDGFGGMAVRSARWQEL